MGADVQMHSLLLSPRSIIASLTKQNYTSYLPYCEAPHQLQGLGFNEMLGTSDAQAGPSSDPPPASATHDDEASVLALDDLLAECTLAVTEMKWQRSIKLINYLRQRASPEGDSSERVITQFVDSLAARVVFKFGESQAANQLKCVSHKITDAELQGAYLSLNQVTPFIRFTHLTANQAILEALQGWDAVHIVDMEIMQGVQWPPLMQALAGRSSGPPKIRISGAGSNVAILEQTGNWLTTFATSIGLPAFEFLALHAAGSDIVEILSHTMSNIRAGEALAINMSIPQPNQILLNQGSFLTAMRSLHPTILTLADREVNYKQASLVDRLMEALMHYRALFDSLEATLPPSSVERSNVERVWLKGEIMRLFLGAEGMGDDNEGIILMESQHLKWRDLMRNQGFLPVSHSGFAVSQARLLLRLHYPSQGYQLKEEDSDCLLLGWQGTPLFSVSAWRM